MQELDIISVVRPMTKYAAVVDDPNMVRYHVERALYEATHGRKGPVWLDVPLDVQAAQINEDSLMGYTPFEIPEDEVFIEKKAVEFRERLNSSERPVMLAGNGIRLSGAVSEFHELVKLLGIPVLTTWNGIDLMTEDDPMYFGRPGGLGHRYANFIQQNSDLFLSVGARLNLLQTGYNFNGFARGAYKVQVDIDRNELQKTNVRPDMTVCADAGTFIKAVLKHSDMVIRKKRTDWFDYAQRMKEKYPLILPEYREEKGAVNTYCLIEAISDRLTGDDIYVSGSSGSCIDISMQGFRVKKGQRVFCTKGLASMGYGLPSTIGACLAGGRRRTVSVNGDGGFAMNIQELETIRRLQLPIKIFVLSNHGYGAIQATQTNIFNRHFVACNEESGLTLPDVSRIAEAYGIKTVTIRDMDELYNRVDEVLAYDGPVVCSVMTPIELTARPKQVSYKRSDGQMESLPLEYMNPPIPDEEMEENMLIPMYERH